jgi:hypothetical protein
MLLSNWSTHLVYSSFLFADKRTMPKLPHGSDERRIIVPQIP